ncbi:hypothetical protein K438DRAFT_1749239 [Mycena galopus ATCC 62051]|nr:hypothetical protein K438DRAFT_1749239 [Mycena galopus ATCC 62051]
MPKLIVLNDETYIQLLQHLEGSTALRPDIFQPLMESLNATVDLPAPVHSGPSTLTSTASISTLNSSTSTLIASPCASALMESAASSSCGSSSVPSGDSSVPSGDSRLLPTEVHIPPTHIALPHEANVDNNVVGMPFSQENPEYMHVVDEEMPAVFLTPQSPATSSSASSASSSPDPYLNMNGKRPPGGTNETPLLKKVMLRIHSLAQVQAKLRAAAAQPAGNAGGAGGGDVSKCPRKGDAARMGRDNDIGDVDCDILGCRDCSAGVGGHSNADTVLGAAAAALDQSDGETEVLSSEDDEISGQPSPKKKRGKGKRAKKLCGYTTKGKGPPLTKSAGELLGALLATISLPDKRCDLNKLLDGLEQNTDDIDLEVLKTLDAVVHRLNAIQHKVHINSFWYMVALVQLAMHVHSATRLAALCASTSPYILVLIAVAEMQDDFTSKKCSSNDNIIALCSAFREISLPTDDKWGPLVQRLHVPLEYIQNKSPVIDQLQFCYRIPSEERNIPEVLEFVPFHSLIQTDKVLEEINTNFAKLPPRSKSWYEPPIPQWVVPTNGYGDPHLPDVHTIRTPKPHVKTLSPVSLKTSAIFTEREREAAEDANIALNLDDLEELSRKVLCIEDATGKFLAENFSLPPHLLQKLREAIPLVQAAMPGEWKADNSTRIPFSYASFHYSSYAQFGEKGDNAPQDAAHLNNVQRDHGGRVNFSQRIPHELNDITDHPQEFAILSDAFNDIFKYIQVVIQKRHPEAYMRLTAYCDVLPMNAACPYLFGGFVLNLRAATWGHRDPGDLVLCVAIPLGDFIGGELCLYELGLKFKLKMGDVLIFPSCDLTHFNMHFQGKRGTVVLHSDRQGEEWVRNCRG